MENGETSNNFINAGMHELKQTGFSNKILETFLDKNLETSYEDARVNFFRKLSDNLSSPFPERIFNSKLIKKTNYL